MKTKVKLDILEFIIDKDTSVYYRISTKQFYYIQEKDFKNPEKQCPLPLQL